MRELEEKILELYEQGICPPYTLVVKDGEGQEVHLSVTMEMTITRNWTPEMVVDFEDVFDTRCERRDAKEREFDRRSEER